MTATPDQAGTAGRPARPRWVGWAGFALGVLLLTAAAGVLLSRPERLGDLTARLGEAPWWAVAFILLSPLANWLLVSACLWMLLRRHGRVGLGEMNALVGSAWLLNHLPMRPGLIGRVGYHRLVNNIRVRDAVEATLWSLGLAAASGLMAFGLAARVGPEAGGLAVALLLLGPPCVVGALAAGLGWIGRARGAWILGALAARYADMGLWAVRYAVVFGVMGVEMSAVQIVMVTAVSQVAQLVPIAGGGMGLREWLVGLTAGSLVEGFEAALAGDLINRGAETLVVIPVGLISGAVVARRVARFRADAKAEPRPETEGAPA